MKLIVTGGAGFIGSNLVRHLLRYTDHEVLNIDKLTYAGNLQSLAAIENNRHYQFCHADIVDTEKMRSIFSEFKPHAIIHLAAESHVDRSIDSPAEFLDTNIMGTYSLLGAAREYYESLEGENKSSFRFLHVSTDEVYGSLRDTGPGFNEITRYDPRSPYSASKAASDHLVRAWYATYELPVLVTNCSNNYGPYQFPEKLIPVVILKILLGERIPVYGAGDNIRDWLYVEDHVRALIKVLDKGAVGETYNVGGNNEVRNIDLVKKICALMDDIVPWDRTGNTGIQLVQGYQDLINFVPDRPGHDKRYAIDSSKIKAELGWEPLESLSTGLEKTLHWYLDNKKWWQDIISGNYQLNRLGLAGPGA